MFGIQMVTVLPTEYNGMMGYLLLEICNLGLVHPFHVVKLLIVNRVG